MRVVEGDIAYLGYRTHYRVVRPRHQDSSKAPLVLLHGGPGSTHDYLEVLDPLADRDGRTLVMYDQLGCGKSWDDAMAGHPELWQAGTWVGELANLRQALGIGECHLLGQSWGGMLAIQYLVDEQPSGIHSVVLSSTLSSAPLWAKEQHRKLRYLAPDEQAAVQKAEEGGDYDDPAFRAVEKRFMELFAGGPFGKDDPECLTRPRRVGRESYLVAWGDNELMPTGNLKDWDYTARLGEIRQPALVISGTDDLCGPQVAKVLADGIAGSRWELMSGCRHMCYVDDNPRYLDILQGWLDAHEWEHRSWPSKL